MSYWYPLGQVVSFKREVYRRAMKELSTNLFNFEGDQTGTKGVGSV